MEESKIAREIASGDGNNQLRVKLHKANAINLDLMHEAIEAGDYKTAMHYTTIANVTMTRCQWKGTSSKRETMIIMATFS